LIKQAERDLTNARKTIGIDAYELAAFVAQQAVEKYLEAAWLVDLNADYTTARYPDAANGVPYEVYDRATAERKVAAAEELFGWLRRLTETGT
jgi:HEPN domain-containing protein